MEHIFADVLEIMNGRNQKKVEDPNGKYPIYGSGGIMGYANDFICPANTVIIGRKGSINKPLFVETPFWNVDTAFGLVANKSVLLPKYLFYFCKWFNFEKLNSTVTIPSLTKTNLLKIRFEVPSISKQQMIIEKLETIESILKRRQDEIDKLDNLIKARFVEMFGDPRVRKSSLTTSTFGAEFPITSGGTPSTKNPEYWENGTIPWIGSNMCQNTIIYSNDGKYITDQGLANSSAKVFMPGTVLIALVGATIGKTGLLRIATSTNQNVAAVDVNSNNHFLPEYVFYEIQSLYFKFQEIGSGKFKMANQDFIRKLPLLVPPLEEQKRFGEFACQIDKSKVAIQKALDKAQLLFDCLMQEYFG